MPLLRGLRGGIAECFPATNNDTGLDHYQVRTYLGWYRQVTLCPCSPTPASPSYTPEQTPRPPGGPHDNSDDLIPVTVTEIRRLIAALLLPTTHEPAHPTRWSR